jgi:phosphotransferase system enzyme I (PtsI)
VLLTLLVGLGLTEFSMAASAIPVAKQLLRGVRLDQARTIAGSCLRAATPAEVEKALTEYLAPQR